MNTWFRLINRNSGLVALFILLLLFTRPIDGDGDFFQHVNIGRYVVVHHTLPRTDDLTFTAAGREYTAYAWASGVLFYAIYSAVGSLGMNALVLVLAFLTFWLLYRYLKSLSIPMPIIYLTMLLTAGIAATRWPMRPEIFMYPILLGILLIDEEKKRHGWIVLFYPILMLAVVTLYGSGFPMVAMLLGLLVVKNIIKGERRWLYYVSIVVSFCIAPFNGYGVKSLFFLAQIPRMTGLWGDWAGIIEIIRRPDVQFAREVILIYSLFTGYFLLVVVRTFKKAKGYLFFVLLACAICMPFLAVRMRVYAALLSAPLLALLLGQQQSKWLIYAGYAVSIVSMSLFIATNPPGIGDNVTAFPSELVEFMKTNGLDGNVFNTPRIGSFLSYHLAPDIRVFTDTRDDLFVGTGVMEVTEAFLSRGASISYLLSKYDTDIVVVHLSDGDSPRDLVYDDAWALVYFKDKYLIFVQKNIAVKKSLTILNSIDPYAPNGVKNNEQ